MKHQKITNLSDNASNQPSKFRTKSWAEINNESRGGYNVNSQIKFKTTMIKPSLCDHSDAYIFVKGTITVDNTSAARTATNNTNKKIMLKKCIPCIQNMAIINEKHLQAYGNIVKIYEL